MASLKSTKTNIPKKGVILRVNSDARATRPPPEAAATAAGARWGGSCERRARAGRAARSPGDARGGLRARDPAPGRGGCGPLAARSRPSGSASPGGAAHRPGAVATAAGGGPRGPRGRGESQNFPPRSACPRRRLRRAGGMFSREERGRGAPRVWGARGSLRTRARQGGEQRRRAGPGTRGSRSRQSPRASP